jgi:hypothetical protein
MENNYIGDIIIKNNFFEKIEEPIIEWDILDSSDNKIDISVQCDITSDLLQENIKLKAEIIHLHNDIKEIIQLVNVFTKSTVYFFYIIIALFYKVKNAA